MKQIRHNVATLLTLSLSGFVVWIAVFGAFESLIQRSIFLAFVLTIAFLKFPLFHETKWRKLGVLVDTVLCLGSLYSCLWITLNAKIIIGSLPDSGTAEIAMTTILVISILELSRRAIGNIFPCLILAGLAYALFGNYIPGPLSHRGFDIYFITETLFLSDIGIWGALLGVAATIIAVFSLFGAFLLHSGAGAAFMDLAIKVSGRSIGGAAKIATVASGMFGMVSGSAVGNVATTGAFTIPLMKRLRYPPAMAGAVEAVASTGGQLAPPIMGAAAFIMAEIIGSDYLTIAIAATLPAFLFYWGVFATIHITSKEEKLGQVPEDEIPLWRQVLTPDRVAPIVLALGGLIYGIAQGRSLLTCAFYGIVGSIIGMAIASIYVGISRQSAAESSEGNIPSLAAREFKKRFRAALDEGATGLIIVGILLAGAQVLVTMINLTGVGVALSTLIVGDGGSSILFIGMIVAIVCLIMGMGIPTTAAYVLVAATLAPALIKLGIQPLAAHMFVFYYATLSVITPPVCIGVFVAAGLAGESWTAVAKRAVRLAAVTYVIPFLFLLYPGMLMPSYSIAYLEAILSGLIFVAAFAYLFGGARLTAWKYFDYLAWLVVAVLATTPNRVSLAFSAVILFVLIFQNRRFSSKKTTVAS